MTREKANYALRDAPLLDQLRYAKTSKGTIHDVQLPDVTAALTEYYIYTTAVQRHPGRFFRDFRPRRKTERINKEYARRTYQALQDAPEFKDAIKKRRLGEALAKTFQTVTGEIVFQSPIVLDAKKSKEKPDGTFAYEKVIFTAPIGEKAKLAVALQVLPRARESSVTVVTYDDDPMNVSKIELRDSTEHTARYMSRLVRAIKEDDERNQNSNSKRKITLPRQKSSLVFLEHDLGETLPPDERAKEVAMNDSYRRMHVLIQEDAEHIPTEIIKWPNKLVTDDAPVFQAWRDGYKDIIDERRGAHKNKEQDPKRKRRPMIEEDIRLKRKRTRRKDIEPGPTSSQPLSPLETAIDSAIEFVQDLKGKPWETIPEVIVKPLLGKIELAVKSVPYALKTGIAAGYLGGDVKAWFQERRVAKMQHRTVKKFLEALIVTEERKQKQN